MSVEIQVYGMFVQPNGDTILSSALDLPQEPQHWDILVKGYPEGFDEDWIPVLEIDELTEEETEPWLKKIRALFPDAEEETV